MPREIIFTKMQKKEAKKEPAEVEEQTIPFRCCVSASGRVGEEEIGQCSICGSRVSRRNVHPRDHRRAALSRTKGKCIQGRIKNMNGISYCTKTFESFQLDNLLDFQIQTKSYCQVDFAAMAIVRFCTPPRNSSSYMPDILS